MSNIDCLTLPTNQKKKTGRRKKSAHTKPKEKSQDTPNTNKRNSLKLPALNNDKQTFQPTRLDPSLISTWRADLDSDNLFIQEDSSDKITMEAKGQENELSSSNNQAKTRFKKLARMIKMNLLWAKDVQDKQDDDEEKASADAFVVNASETQDTLTFDLNYFRAKQSSYGGLTSRTRRILLKHPIDRTDEDLTIMKDVVDRLKCFDKYSRKVKHELARVISYEVYEDGRVIIQQGHVGISFYFIVHGAVLVRITETDRTTGTRHHQVLGELTTGQSFGEMALLHDIKRTATIVCKGKSEFLRIDKEDFDDVLKMSCKREWSERLAALRWLPAFRSWRPDELESCNNTCKMAEYPGDTVILGGANSSRAGQERYASSSDYVYFITSGEVRVVRELVLVQEQQAWGKTRLSLPTEEQSREISGGAAGGHADGNVGRSRGSVARRNRTIFNWRPSRHLWTVFTLSKGSYFSVGEDLTDTFIVSKDKVECLLVPRLLFMKYGRGEALAKFRDDLQALLPSNETTFRHYCKELRWRRYKSAVINEAMLRQQWSRGGGGAGAASFDRGVARQRHNNTTLADVPLVIRRDAHQEHLLE